MKTFRFDTVDDLCDRATETIERIAAEAIAERGAAHIALSGGRTPRPLFRMLARCETIDWRHIHIYWSDERCVAPTSTASNYHEAEALLLRDIPVPKDRVHRIEGERLPLDAADAYEVMLRDTLGPRGRLDLILLGVGANGHTASLFPRHQALSESQRWILPVHVSAEPPWRITMTFPLLNAARHVLFLVTGAEKANAMRAIADGEPFPAALVQPTDGTAVFLVDREAASLLP